MKKNFSIPEIRVIRLVHTDIITESEKVMSSFSATIVQEGQALSSERRSIWE